MITDIRDAREKQSEAWVEKCVLIGRTQLNGTSLDAAIIFVLAAAIISIYNVAKGVERER